MNKIKKFFDEYGSDVITVVVIFLTLLTLFSILGVDFRENKHKHIEKIVTVETLKNKGPNLSSKKGDNVCKYGNNPKKDKFCLNLSKNNCNIPDCCVLVKKAKKRICTVGNSNGPIYYNRYKPYDGFSYLGKFKKI